MKEHWIWLTRRTGLGPVKQRQLLERFGTAEALWSADRGALAGTGLPQPIQNTLLEKDLTEAAAICHSCRERGIRVLTLADGDYPSKLSAVADAPAVLYLRGSLPDPEHRPCIGLVGARRGDFRGLENARRLGWQLSGCGAVVVTGMARGIDAAGAEGALDQGGAVIGVLGCGVDVVYPRENAALFARTAANGCLVSEYPPGVAPNGKYFPARNRIISALSDGIVVVQASEHSGALITARWAADQGRDVFAVPGPAGEELSRGGNRLLREGAILAESGWDVMSEYEYRYPGSVREYHGRPPCPVRAELPGAPRRGQAAPAVPMQTPAAPETRTPPAAQGKICPRAPADAADLSPVQQRVVQALQAGPLQLDALIHQTGIPAAELLPQLTLLQMKHILTCLPGRIYTISEH